MPFFDKIRQALGFSDGEDDIDDAIIRDDAPSNKYRHLRENADTAQATRETTRETDSPEPAAASPRNTDDADKAAVIFDRIIEVFNQSLPDFLKQSIDPDAQRKYLYKSLDDGLKAYIASLKDEAAREAEARWRKDNDALQTSVKNLEQRAREIEDKRTEISQKQMSSDRQRRALSERVHDLESTVARLEAEKEQFELERQSMINKLKVAAVFEKENTELHDQIEQMMAKRSNAPSEADTAAVEALNAQVAEARQQVEDAKRQAEDAQKQAEDARKQVDDIKKQTEDAKQQAEETIAKLNDQVLELQIELEAAPKDDGKAAIEALNAQVAEAHRKTEDAKRQVEDARKQAEELQTQATQLQKQLNEAKQKADNGDTDALRAQVDELQTQVMAERRKNSKAQNTIKELQRQIEEGDPMNDPEIQRQLKEIHARLEQYEQQKKLNEDTIASLKSQLEDERRKNAAAKSEPKAAAKHADARLPLDETTPKNKTPRPLSSKVSKSAEPQNAPSIDDILGDTDWVVRQDNTSKSRSRNADRNKPKVDDDPQMKLF